MRSPEITAAERSALATLDARLGHLHVRQRLGLERDHEAQIFRQGTHFFHIENWYSMHGLIRCCLRLTGLHARGRRNALDIRVRRHDVILRSKLPSAFDGFTILHLSDLHVDSSIAFADALVEQVRPLDYDLCVLTGDYRTRTFGPVRRDLGRLQRLRRAIKGSAYAAPGNHDTLRLVPSMEAMDYRLLMNESAKLTRGAEAIYLSGIDDAHYYRMENFHRAAHDIPSVPVSTPPSDMPRCTGTPRTPTTT